jgi:hypothetical protein
MFTMATPELINRDLESSRLEEELNGRPNIDRLRNVYALKREKISGSGWETKLDEVKELLRGMAEYDDRQGLLTLVDQGLIVSSPEQAVNVLAHAYEKGELSSREIETIENLLGKKIIAENASGLSNEIEQKNVEEVKEVKENKLDVPFIVDHLDSLRKTRSGKDFDKLDTLIKNIRNAVSTDEVQALLRQAHAGKWTLPDDPETAKSMVTDGTIVSTGIDGKKQIGALISDEEYQEVISGHDIQNEKSELQEEDPSVWKRTRNKIISIVNSISDSVMSRKDKSLLIYELTGADRKETAEALKGVVPPTELHKFEDFLEGLSKEEKDPDTTSIPMKKQSTVIEFPSNKKKIEIDGESFRGDLEEKYGEKHSPTAEAMLSDREENRNGVFATEAKKFYADGDIGNALASVERIIDRNIQSQTVHEIIVECQKNQDIYNIKKFIGKLRDVKYKETLTNWLNGEMRLVVDPIESRVPTEDMSLNKPEPVSPYEDKASEPVPEVVPEIDLPLNNGVPNVIDVGDVVLEKEKLYQKNQKLKQEKFQRPLLLMKK